MPITTDPIARARALLEVDREEVQEALRILEECQAEQQCDQLPDASDIALITPSAFESAASFARLLLRGFKHSQEWAIVLEIKQRWPQLLVQRDQFRPSSLCQSLGFLKLGT